MEKHQEIESTPLRIVSLELEVIDPLVGKPQAPSRPRAGDLCPQCGSEQLDYDGLLNLSCPKCGVITGGCFT